MTGRELLNILLERERLGFEGSGWSLDRPIVLTVKVNIPTPTGSFFTGVVHLPGGHLPCAFE